MIEAFIQFADGRTSRDTDPRTLSAALRDPGSRFWVDMQSPTDDEIALLDDVFGFHPLAIEDTTLYTQRPKIESYNHVGDALRQGYFYMVIHGPDMQSLRQRLRTKEIDLFVSERYLVSVHDEQMEAVDEVKQRANADPRLVLEPGIDMLLHNLLDHLVDKYRPILDSIESSLDDLEEEALTNPSPGLLNRISIRKRELLNFRRIVGPQRELLAHLTRGDVPFIRETTRIYLRDVLDHLIRTVEMLELYRDLVLGARDIYLSSVSNRLNQIMKTLTIISVIALPLTVITSFFGMNFQWIPGLHSQIAFWTITALMGVIVAGLLYFFSRKHWL